MKKYLVTGIILFAMVSACHVQKKVVLDCSAVAASYSKDIAPIVSNNCMPCHKAGSVKGDFTTYDGLNIVAKSGALESHVLIKQDMPPKGPLVEEDRKKIRCWLNNGAQNN
jgi:hypothetical protein